MQILTQVERVLDVLSQKSMRRDLVPLVDSINLASNDYLSIQQSHLVSEFLCNVAPKINSPFSSSASRSIYGHPCHFELERKLDEMYGRKSLLFSSGYAANLGALGALSTLSNIVFIVDESSHASIFHAISKAPFARFSHNDMNSLESKLEMFKSKRAIIVTEALFSMDGDFCDINALLEIKMRFNALLFIDAAHSIFTDKDYMLGIKAPKAALEMIDFISLGFGKALSSMGGAILTSELFHKFFINHAKTLIFSTATAPINCAFTHFVLSKMPLLESSAQKLQANAREIKKMISEKKLNLTGNAHILSIITGSNESALKVERDFLKEGIFSRAIRHPSVKRGSERVRLCINASLTPSDLAKINVAIEKIE